MKSTFNILSAARNLLNVPEFTELITGQIYKISRPNKSQKIDVVLNTLTIGSEYLQSGYMNVNIYVKNLQTGLVDSKKLEELNAAAISLLDQKKSVPFDIIVVSNGQEQSLIANASYVFFNLDSPGVVLKDQESENTHFINIKLKYNTL